MVGRLILKLWSMLERVEAPTDSHWRATTQKNVSKSYEPVVNARDLVVQPCGEDERAGGTK
jgi:hypothetical protein